MDKPQIILWNTHSYLECWLQFLGTPHCGLITSLLEVGMREVAEVFNRPFLSSDQNVGD